MKLTYRNRRIEDEHWRPLLVFTPDARRDNPPEVIDRLGRIMAEAPELLEALEALTEAVGYSMYRRPFAGGRICGVGEFEHAQKVIAKAKGQL